MRFRLTICMCLLFAGEFATAHRLSEGVVPAHRVARPAKPQSGRMASDLRVHGQGESIGRRSAGCVFIEPELTSEGLDYRHWVTYLHSAG
jgi:hypothetical protein